MPPLDPERRVRAPRHIQAVGPPRVALVHDWLVGQRGGENVLLHMARLFPDAPIYTLVHARAAVHPDIEAHPIVTSMIQHLPGAPRRFRQYLPLFPWAMASFDLSAFDVILSTSHCVAHGVTTAAHQRHIAYVHTPMRYLYDQMAHYLPPLGRSLSAPLARRLTAPLRAWDVAAAQAPTTLVANSAYVAQRVRRVWGRHAEVLYPPVDVDYFAAAQRQKRHGLLYVGALVPYKRADCAIDLANHLGEPLQIIGDGPERAALQRRAGPHVTFHGNLSRQRLRQAYAGAEALIFAGEEDFGIVPVEAMAAGCPVLARNGGGLAETVAGDGPAASGVLFDTPTVGAMAAALATLRARQRAGALAPAKLLRRARQFDTRVFVRGIAELVARTR